MRTEQKYYIGNYKKITIRCLACKKNRTVTVEDLKRKHHVIKVVCPCSHAFVVNLEFRQSYRMQLNIVGSYRKSYEPIEQNKSCTVRDISRGGLGVTITNDNTIKVGDELIVSFKLGALQQHKFEAACQVRHIDSGIIIGGMFTPSKLTGPEPVCKGWT
jgi:c-di-GMP-binding flagellar brake protein YcgR